MLLREHYAFPSLATSSATGSLEKSINLDLGLVSFRQYLHMIPHAVILQHSCCVWSYGRTNNNRLWNTDNPQTQMFEAMLKLISYPIFIYLCSDLGLRPYVFIPAKYKLACLDLGSITLMNVNTR